jgi:hypothetical protein
MSASLPSGLAGVGSVGTTGNFAAMAAERLSVVAVKRPRKPLVVVGFIVVCPVILFGCFLLR